MDDFGVSLVTKGSQLFPGLTTARYSLGFPNPLSPMPAKCVNCPGAGQDFTAVQHTSWDEVFLSGPQGNLFSVDE